MRSKLLNWFRRFFWKETLYEYRYVDDLPDILKSNVIYIVGNEGFYWQAVMVCPCGCKKPLHMNLNKQYYPYWKIHIANKGKISLSPSIDRMVGCKSHFFVRKGKIVWA